VLKDEELEWISCEPTEREREFTALIERWERTHRAWLESLLILRDLLFPKNNREIQH